MFKKSKQEQYSEYPDNIEKLIENNPQMRDIKRQAKTLYKQLKPYQSISLIECQERIVKTHGFKHWHEFHTNIKNLYKLHQIEYIHYVNDFKSGNLIWGFSEALNQYASTNIKHLISTVSLTGQYAERNQVELHLLKQLIDSGSHVLYMDGNSDSTYTNKIKQLAIDAGREKDIRHISFMTAWQKSTNWFLPENLPYGSAALTEMIYPLLKNDSNEMWKGKAISLISAVMMALTYMRDTEGFILNFKTMKPYFELQEIEALQSKTLPSHIAAALRTYLKTIHSFKGAIEIHTMLRDKVWDAIALIGQSYSHLFKGNQDGNAAKEHLNDLFGINKHYIFIVEFPDFSKAPELHNVSYFWAGLLRSNLNMLYAPSYNECETRQYQESLQGRKSERFLFFKDCPLLKGMAVLPCSARGFNSTLFFSYTKFQQDAWGEFLPPIRLTIPTYQQYKQYTMHYQVNIANTEIKVYL